MDITARALTKAAKARRVTQILHAGLGRVPDADARWLIDEVFCNHPRWALKRGGGVAHVEVRTMPAAYGSVAFWLVRTDGSSVDISYRESIRPQTQRGKVMSAARCEIEHQIGEWRKANPAPEAGMHCDHADPPFDALFAAFLAAMRLSDESTHLSVDSDEVGRFDRFGDRECAVAWQFYHRRHAKLQWLSAAENLAKSNKIVPPALSAIVTPPPLSAESESWVDQYERADHE